MFKGMNKLKIRPFSVGAHLLLAALPLEPYCCLPSELQACSKYFLTLINHLGMQSGSHISKLILLECILMTGN